MSIAVAYSSSPAVLALLSRHPRVQRVDAGRSSGVEFIHGGRRRDVQVGNVQAEVYGLLESVDNNPIVCADRISVPGPAATLALLAVGPISQSGLLIDPPVVALNFEDDGIEAKEALLAGAGEITLHSEPIDLGSVLAATAMASIRTPDEIDDLDGLYEERYGRSFFVRRDEGGDWVAALVAGKPFAVYRLRISTGAPHSLLSVRVMADRDGKCGAAQVVHAMNVMCGFEESLGLL